MNRLFTPYPRAALLLTACGGLIACSGGPGDGTETPDPASPTPTEADGATPTEAPTPTDDPASRQHCGDITGDEVWRAGVLPHTITCDTTVKGGSITIEAGAEVEVAAGGLWLYVESGDLKVEGTVDAPVTFRGVDGGGWYGIQVGAGAGDVSFSYAGILGAFQIPGTIDNNHGPLVVRGATVHVDHLTVDGPADCGVVIKDDGALSADSQALVVTGAEGWAVCASPKGAGTIPGAATGTDLTGNTADGVLVSFDDSTLTEPSRWDALGAPYVIYGPMYLDGTADSPAVLTLSAGADVRFRSAAYFRLSRYAGAATGGLITEGTAEAPVRLSGYEGEGRSAWSGILAYNPAVLSFSHTVMEGGGTANNGAVNVWGGELAVDHLSISGSAGYGFSLVDGAVFAEGSQGLVIHDVAKTGRVYAEAVGSIPEEGIDLTGNDTDFVSIEGQGGPAIMTSSQTWGVIGVAYKVASYLDLEGTASKPTVLTLEPGVHVTFAHNSYLGIGGRGAAALVAQGTAEDPITFTSSESLSAGSWAALYFSADTIGATTVLDHVEVGYAGADYFYRRQGAIIVDSASLTIGNTRIHDSACNGISLYGTASPTIDMDTTSFDGVGAECAEVHDETP